MTHSLPSSTFLIWQLTHACCRGVRSSRAVSSSYMPSRRTSCRRGRSATCTIERMGLAPGARRSIGLRYLIIALMRERMRGTVPRGHGVALHVVRGAHHCRPRRTAGATFICMFMYMALMRTASYVRSRACRWGSRHAMHRASGPSVSGRPLSSGSAYRYYYYRWGSDLISRGIHLLEVHEGFGEMVADMGHFDKARLGDILS